MESLNNESNIVVISRKNPFEENISKVNAWYIDPLNFPHKRCLFK